MLFADGVISAQGTWTQKANFGGSPRYAAAGFSIGNKGYIGTGAAHWLGPFYNDFWEFDPLANTWTQKANFSGGAMGAATGFSIGNKGYIATGSTNLTPSCFCNNQLWEYDPLSNLWTQKANFSGTARSFAAGFSIGTKGYIGTGFDGTNKNDFWEWDQPSNTWSQKASFGGVARCVAFGYSVGGKGYIGTGWNSGIHYNDFWEYNPAGNNWTQKANFTSTLRAECVGFSLGNNLYVGTGTTNVGTGPCLSDFWKYDPSANSWSAVTNFPGGARECAVGFSIGCKGYIGTGWTNDVPASIKNDFWEFDPGSVSSGNLVVNGDFSAGNTGFTSGHIFTGTNTIEGQYGIVTNPQLWNGGMSSCTDHTSGSGQMLVVNGSTTANVPVYCQNISVLPNTTYTLGFWGMSAFPGNPANLEVLINNVPLAPSFQLPNPVCTWQQYLFSWNSGTNTNANLCIMDQDNLAFGNDFAIDDISFIGCNPPPVVTATLTPTYNDSACGLNYVMGSVLIETRYNAFTVAGNLGTGLPTSITISGLPACPVIEKAYLWYTVSYINASPQVSTVDVTNPVPSTSNYPATNIGVDIAKCWGETGTVVYRADVTSSISGNGVYGLNINGITGTGGAFAFPYDQIDGATLFIIYKDLSAAYEGSLVIWDGNITSVGGAPVVTMSGFNVCAPSSNANAFLIVSDMQDNNNGNLHPSTLNGATANYPNTFWSFDQVNTTVTAGQNTSVFGTDGMGGDCFTLAMTGLYYQTTTCTTCTPSAFTTSVSSTPAGCVGNSGTATANPSGGVSPYTYVWNPTGQTSQTATGLAAGSYTVTVTDATGCVSINSVSVSITPPAVISAGNDQTTCLGTGVTLNASGGVSYSWAPSTGLSNNTISNPGANPTSSTTYTVIGTDVNGCTNSDIVQIFINPLPSVNAGPDASVCQGNSTTLNATGTGTFSWSPSTGLSCTTCPNPVASPSSATSYTVTLTDANTCRNTDVVTVSIYPAPSVSAGADASICFGASTTLAATGTGSFSWSPSGGLSCTSCANPTANPTATTNYTVTITDGNSCTNTDVVQVTVNPLPVPAPGPKPGYVCPGFSESLTASGGGAYNWSPSSSLNNANISNPIATPTVTTIYTVTVTDVNGCVNSDTIKILVAAEVPTFAGNDVSICIGQSTALLGGNPTSPNGTYYTWTPSTGLNNSTLANPTASPTTTTTYTLVTANDTCAGTDTVTVYVNPLPVVSAGADVTICLFDSTGLNASGGTGYVWTPASGLSNPAVSNPMASPSSSNNYTVTVTDANGCTRNDVMLVFVNPLPPADAGLNDTLCFGDSVQLNASGGILYSWNPSSGLSNPNISNPVSSATGATNYTVTVTDGNGCSNTDSVAIFIWQLPVITAFSDTSVCSGGSALLTATGGTSYVWSPASGLNNPNISNPTATPSSATTYVVTGTDANGCRNADSVVVSINIMPLADFGYSLIPACEGMKAKFLDSSLNATQWLWNLGNGSTSTLQNPITVFPYLGSYTVTLIASRPPCEDTVSQVIGTGSFPDSVIVGTANVFTPNNDGLNDCFRIQLNGEFSGCADLVIYNRWGVPVFHTTYSGVCWDGTTDAGIAASDGTYYYILDVNGVQEKGFVTLLR